MKLLKHKYALLAFVLFATLTFSLFTSVASVQAASNGVFIAEGDDGTTNDDGPVDRGSDSGSGSADVVSDLDGVEKKDDDCKQNFQNMTKENCSIVKLISTITTALSGVAMLVIIMMVVAGGVQYSAAGGDSSKVQAAKSKIANALLALFLLIFGFSILQWLVPGGIF